MAASHHFDETPAQKARRRELEQRDDALMHYPVYHEPPSIELAGDLMNGDHERDLGR
jgi:hypothetical protein